MTGWPGNSTGLNGARAWSRHSAGAKAPTKRLVFRLSGLDPQATYTVTDVDLREAREISGSELLQEGLPVTIKAQSAAVIISYRKTK